jgi:DNA-binding NarL/FixJ family response regulator
MSEGRLVTVLIGSVKPTVARGLAEALSDDERLRVLEGDILEAIHRAAGEPASAHANGTRALARHEGERNLTERQADVLRLLSDGFSDPEIADALTISVGTVHTHVKRIFRKMNVHSRRELRGLPVKYRKSDH